MKKITLKALCLMALFLLCANFPLKAQTDEVPYEPNYETDGTDACWTVDRTEEEMEELPWYGNNAYLDQLADDVEDYLQSETEISFRDGEEDCFDVDSPMMIPIRFWFYQEVDNDPDMPTDLEMQAMMDELNRLYQINNMNVRFFAVCPQFITDPDAVDMNNWQSFWNQFAGANTDAWAINVHVVEDNTSGNGVYNGVGDFIMVERNVYQGVASGLTSTLAHEIGHYFGLDHTHRNHDKGKCRQEAVSRTRNFTIGQFFGCLPPKTGKICEKNGDGLCDTPADPNLSGKVNGSCAYTDSEEDNWGDSYVPNTSNIMSYSRKSCREWFSPGQRAIMWGSILWGRSGYIPVLDLNETDPDRYEPDNSDMVGVPRLISVGETQCHSFHKIGSCQDEVDWLRIETSEGIAGSYIVEIIDVSGADNPVGEVLFWHTDSNGERTDEVDVINIQVNDNEAFEILCSEIQNDILIEVRRSDIKEGKYAIRLTTDPELSLSNASVDLVCQGDSYQVLGLPGGATVSWTSSWNISLSNTSGASTTISNVTQGSSSYWIEATITINGCTTTLRKNFNGTNNSIPTFDIEEVIPACYPPSHPFGRYVTVPSVQVNWSINYGYTTPFGSMTIVEPNSVGWFTLTATATNDCGNTVSVSRNFYADECDDGGMHLVISPNPAKDIVRVEMSTSWDEFSTGEILVTNQYSTLHYQAEINTPVFEFDVSNFENGVYYLHVYSDADYAVEPFVVNKN